MNVEAGQAIGQDIGPDLGGRVEDESGVCGKCLFQKKIVHSTKHYMESLKS
jgi:hypothetical protein